jgi:hypothetical protein
MATNINPNYNPATEQTNQLFNTQIPALSEDANIQEALRLYHYGVGTGLPITNAQIQPNSVAGHLKTLRSDVGVLQSKGPGSTISAALPANAENGFIWVDADSSATVFDTAPESAPSVARYQNEAPTTNLKDGALWVDKDSSPLKMYVYDLALSVWREIGA